MLWRFLRACFVSLTFSQLACWGNVICNVAMLKNPHPQYLHLSSSASSLPFSLASCVLIPSLFTVPSTFDILEAVGVF